LVNLRKKHATSQPAKKPKFTDFVRKDNQCLLVFSVITTGDSINSLQYSLYSMAKIKGILAIMPKMPWSLDLVGSSLEFYAFSSSGTMRTSLYSDKLQFSFYQNRFFSRVFKRAVFSYSSILVFQQFKLLLHQKP
jgi:hypothetical protein